MATSASDVTTNYGLSQWAENDYVLREDFNSDNQIIDGVLAELATRCRFETGAYTGNGLTGPENKRTITFSFTPQIVFVQRTDDTTYNTMMIIALYGTKTISNLGHVSQSKVHLSWEGNSMSFYSDNDIDHLNVNNAQYKYLAIG